MLEPLLRFSKRAGAGRKMKTSRFVRYVIDLPDSDLRAGKTCVRIWDDVMKCEIRLSDHVFESGFQPAATLRKNAKTPAESGWTLGNVVDIRI